MYFWTIILLFFVSIKYIYCVPPREAPDFSQEALIPFTHEYSTGTKKLLENETSGFYVSLYGKIRMGICSVIPSNFSSAPDNNCVTDYTSSPPGYHLADDRECKAYCIRNNANYVRFMNKNISFAIEKLFNENDRNYRIKLNAINSQTGECVRNDDEKKFECDCTTNYQIEINTSFHSTIDRLVNDIVTPLSVWQMYDLRKTSQLSAFTLLLKFHPVTAPLFLGHIFREFRICLENSAGVNLDTNTPNLTGNVSGMVENKGQFIENEKKLFKTIMKEISSTNSCNLRAMADRYFHKCIALKLIILGCLSYGVFEGFQNLSNSYVNLK